jgi:hypothetical protein
MDFIKAVSIIGRDLEEAMAMLDQLSATQGSNIAEIELARSRVRTASELLRLLPGLNGVNAPQPVQEVKNEMVEKVTVESVVVEKVTSETVVEMVEQAPGVQRFMEPVMEAPEPQKHAEPVMEAPVPQKHAEPKKTQEPAKPILADRFAAAGTLGEKITSTKKDEAITSVIHSKPIADIAAAIGINDKFYFIRELFSGNSIAYHETISRLNASSSLGEAMRILDESTVMGSDPAAQSSFVDVVRRKFNIHV